MEIIDTFFSFEVQLFVNGLAFVISFILCISIGVRLLRSIKNPQENQSRLSVFILKLSLLMSVFIVSFYALYKLVSYTPSVLLINPTVKSTFKRFDQPVTLEFNVPVDVAKLKIHTSTGVYGEWSDKRYSRILPFARKFTFTPSETYPENTPVMFYFSNISSVFQKEFGSEFLIEYMSPSAPGVTATLPEDGSSAIPAATDMIVSYEGDDATSLFDAFITPGMYASVESDGRGKLAISVPRVLQQGTEYTLQLYRTPVSRKLSDRSVMNSRGRSLFHSFSFSTAKAPLVTSFLPVSENVLPETPVQIVFDNPMVTESVLQALSISPESSYSAGWSDNGTGLTLRLKDMKKNTAYTFTLGKGMKTITGGTSETDAVFSFVTAGPISVLEALPQQMMSPVPVLSPIRMVFSQKPVRESVEKRFSMSPAVRGRFTWKDNEMQYIPAAPLSYSTTYEYSLDAGYESVGGLPADTGVRHRFTTQPPVFSLNVPLLKQEESFTCNIAALRMLLSYRGVSVSEADVRRLTTENGSRGNGNPHKGYTKEYGTYWEPIRKAAENFRPSKLYTNPAISEILTEVENGNPVMVWGHNGWSDPHELSWTAADGTYIYAINGMHSYVVKGYEGTKEKPSKILINDPWRGDTYLTFPEFNRRFAYFHTALAVY